MNFFQVFLFSSFLLSPAFAERGEETFPNLRGDDTHQFFAGLANFAAGVASAAGAGAMNSVANEADSALKAAQQRLQNTNRERNSDPSLQETYSLRALLAQLQKSRSCSEEIGPIAQRLVELAKPQPGTKSELEWNELTDEATKAVQTASGHVKFFRSVQGLAIFGSVVMFSEIPTRLWVFNVYRRDPGIFPVGSIAYNNALKPTLRFIGIYESLRKGFSGEREREEEAALREQRQKQASLH